jgi:hypothetical protein
MDVGRALIATGLILVLAGLLWLVGSRFGLGHLPGDFTFERGGVRVYIPLGTCILISVALSALAWLIGRL